MQPIQPMQDRLNLDGRPLPSPIDLSQEFETVKSASEGAPSPVRVAPSPNPSITEPLVDPPMPIQQQRRTTRSGRVINAPKKLSPGPGKTYDAFLSQLPATFENPQSNLSKQFAYAESLLIDPKTKLVDAVHPLAFSAKMNDPDTLDYHHAMTSPDKEEFRLAMSKEIDELIQKDTWDIVERPANKNVLPSTWAFKRKRYPDGRIWKHKARFCVRGDKQLPGIDYFDTYAPVVSWSTVRLMLTLTAVLNLQTKQVDYNNAFAQAPITEDVYIELPRDFENSTEGNFVLKLKTSLYGMKQSPLVWFNHLKAGLEKRGFKASASDPCLFLHQDVICLVYVDDCLFFARDQMKIDEMIQDLQKDFALEPEKDVSASL